MAFEWKPKEKPKPIWPWIAVAVALVLLVGSVVTWLLVSNKGKPVVLPSTSPSPSAAPTGPKPTSAPPESPWPSNPDCLAHDPNNVTVTFNGSFNVWQVISGNQAMMAFKRQEDAVAGQALAQAYRLQCFVGRDNTRPDRYRYIYTYWKEPVRPAPAIANPDCLSHDPTSLTVANAGDIGWRVQSGSEYIEVMSTEADANNVLLVMRHHTAHCYVGRGYTGADRLQYIVEWGR
ncbi:MAG: hypothetical protein HOU81_22320 [Hamadaea sp.]|nr:hypothetical protein [Hamadaea sp.]